MFRGLGVSGIFISTIWGVQVGTLKNFPLDGGVLLVGFFKEVLVGLFKDV